MHRLLTLMLDVAQAGKIGNINCSQDANILTFQAAKATSPVSALLGGKAAWSSTPSQETLTPLDRKKKILK